MRRPLILAALGLALAACKPATPPAAESVSDAPATPPAPPAAPAPAPAKPFSEAITAPVYAEYLKTLASDEFEGRGPGSIGERAPPVTDKPTLNRRGASYVGRHLTLLEPIRDVLGWAKVGDGRCRVAGPDLPAGSHVQVVGVDGATLRVAPL